MCKTNTLDGALQFSETGFSHLCGDLCTKPTECPVVVGHNTATGLLYAGHNGIASIIESLGTREFDRIRIGLGVRPRNVDGADWVLSPFEENELESARVGAQEAADRAAEWLAGKKQSNR